MDVKERMINSLGLQIAQLNVDLARVTAERDEAMELVKEQQSIIDSLTQSDDEPPADE